MANPSGKKGYIAEVAVLNHLLSHGFRRAYRLRTQGVMDKGDIGGVDGLCMEVKNHASYSLAAWMLELRRERAHARATAAGLVIKPRGIGTDGVGQWWVMTTLDDYVALIERAGYGPRNGDDTEQQSVPRPEPGP